MSWFWNKTLPPKPEGKIEYGIGFSCDKGHCQNLSSSDTTVQSVSSSEQICEVCGKKSLPSVVKLTSGYVWVRNPYHFNKSFYWESLQVSQEFVRFLDEDTVRLPKETVAKLRKYAARKPVDSDEDADRAYQNGLNDGTILTAQYVLGELEDETNA